MKVYVAFRGDYEQHEPVAVFTTYELAKSEADDLGNDEYDIEEFEVFDHAPAKARCYFFRGSVREDGTWWGGDTSMLVMEGCDGWGLPIVEVERDSLGGFDSVATITVRGFDKDACETRFLELLAAECPSAMLTEVPGPNYVKDPNPEGWLLLPWQSTVRVPK